MNNTETLEQNGQAASAPIAVEPLQQINQANLQLASILEVVLKDIAVRKSLLGAIDRQKPVAEGEVKASEEWLQQVGELFEQKRVATDALVSRAVGGLS
mgnify:CR=1 FL=1